jgi:hypothetical protein
MWKKVNKGNMGKQEIEPSFPDSPRIRRSDSEIIMQQAHLKN